ncbi:undecaprenyl-phosphate glucose phosphotransferase [Marinoscillum sp. MHG1-6]|uniref:undecaprenyl-phosphate glucose phosphotransferase n=1 Tax=Marinoscillum sp. MHG1-6 TaxID=2959627 RepID=UPI0021575AD0|nr:undecaprenyl-phosphate glucose phosphotransferase [Marinoscillum sp. MHG1-6]
MASKRYSKYFPIIFLLADLLALNLSIALANVLKFDILFFSQNEYDLLFLTINVLWIGVFFGSKLHEINRENRLLDHLNSALSALVVNLAIMFALWFVTKPYHYSREHLFYVYFFFSMLCVIWRSIWHYSIRYYRSKGFNARNVIIIGKSRVGDDLVNLFEVDKGIGYKFLGYFDKKKDEDVIGDLEDVQEFALANEVDIIFCYLPKLNEQQAMDLINFAENNLIQVKIISQFSSLGLGNMVIQSYGSVPTINLTALPLDKKLNKVVKRSFDLVFSLFITICLLSWLLPIVALLIKLESKGPVFFKQERNGLNNQKFLIWKFRTMYVHDDRRVVQAKKGDSRITKFGALLRKTSIDELPQFFNVITGDMSVVGPRPHAVQHNEEFRKKIDRFIQRHAVKPGITGLAQAKGFRGETATLSDIQGRVKLDRFYVKNWSLLLDFKIIVLTAISMIRSNENAY